jgi:hypothetical protein
MSKDRASDKHATDKGFFDQAGEISSRSRTREEWIFGSRDLRKSGPVTLSGIRSGNLSLIHLNYAIHWQINCFLET